MERDFLGLNSKSPVVAVKEELVEGRFEDSGFRRSSGVPWLFPSRMPAVKKFEQDEKQAKFSGSPTAMQNFVGRIPVAAGTGAPVSALPLPSGGTEQWIKNKAQLTIFYGGTVCVFDDITPEKAQAIMIMAGKGVIPSSSYLAQPKLASKLVAGDRVPNSGHPSPISVSSRTNDATNDDEMVKVETPKMMTSVISSAVPQMRKESLARFLEKRKERVLNAAPYAMNKKPAEWVAPEARDAGSSSGKEIVGDL